MCDEQHDRDFIDGSSSKEIERMKSCIEIEKQSGAFLFKAITSGAWAEMSKFVVAIKVPPILPNEREYTSR